MGLSQREMSDPVGDLLGGKTELVPNHNAPHGHPGASDTGTASTDAGGSSNQAADFHQGLCAHACNMTQFVLVVKLAIGGFLLALIETLSAKMRIFRAPEFLGTAFLLAVLAMLVHLLLEAGQ